MDFAVDLFQVAAKVKCFWVLRSSQMIPGERFGRLKVQGLTPCALYGTDDKAEEVEVSPHTPLYLEIQPGCEVKSSGNPS